MVRQDGAITRWNDERGFGFITPVTGGSPVFVHVSELPRGTRPLAGTVVSFLTTRDERDRLRASDVQYVGSAERRTQTARGVPAAAAVSISFLSLLGVLAVIGVLPRMAVALSLLLSVVAFALYRTDKAAAIQGARRTPEQTLHFVSLLGGWPGALVAQHVYHHKTRKQPFQTVYWLTVIANCAVLAWIATGQPFPL